MPRRPRAFSLVELLVALGIIALLIALLMPALARARRHANSLKCAARLRQVGVAMVNYAAFNRGSYPAYSTDWQRYHAEGQPDDGPGPGWTERLDPYLPGGERNYDCPEFPPDIPFNYFLASRWAYSRGQRSLRFNQIRHPSEFFLVAETTTLHAYPKPIGDNVNPTDDCDKDDALLPLLFFPDNPATLTPHPDGTHLLFADGHVAAFRRFDPARITFDPQHEGRTWDDVTPP